MISGTAVDSGTGTCRVVGISGEAALGMTDRPRGFFSLTIIPGRTVRGGVDASFADAFASARLRRSRKMTPATCVIEPNGGLLSNALKVAIAALRAKY